MLVLIFVWCKYWLSIFNYSTCTHMWLKHLFIFIDMYDYVNLIRYISICISLQDWMWNRHIEFQKHSFSCFMSQQCSLNFNEWPHSIPGTSYPTRKRFVALIKGNLLEDTRPKNGRQVFHRHVIYVAVIGNSGQEVDEVIQNNEVVVREVAKIFSQGAVQFLLVCRA